MTLNGTLTDKQRVFHPKAAKYTFKCTWNIFQDRSLLGHKINLRKLKKLYQASFFYHNSMKRNKLQEKTLRNTNTGWLNNMQLNNHWITEEIKEEIKKIPRDA